MHSKFMVGALLASVALFPAFAQQTPTPAPRSNAPTAAPTQSTQPATAPTAAGGQWRASKLVGVNVYNNNNEKIGDINEILLDDTGKVTGVVIGVGGFLGMGEHDVVVKLSDLKFVNEPRRTSATTSNSVPPATTTGTATNRPVRDANEKWYPDHAVMNATKDQLKAMPAFKYN